MHSQLAVPLANLPVSLVLISNGMVGLSHNRISTVIYDQPEQGISAIITPEKMLVGNEEVVYNRAISLEAYPELKKWIIQQQLEQPY
jgi:hypothetical protein